MLSGSIIVAPVSTRRLPDSPRANRGPAAAAENRSAVLRSARRLFAEHGLHVPLTAIAQDAGVGQGVLYRHFPTRMDLALAVFDENLDHIEEVATQATAASSDSSATDPFTTVWQELLTLSLADIAFVEIAVQAVRNDRALAANGRLRRVVAPLLDEARARGSIDSRLSVADFFLALRASYGVVSTAMDAAAARADIDDLMTRLGLPGLPERH